MPVLGKSFRDGSEAVVKHGTIAACLVTPLLSSEKTVLHSPNLVSTSLILTYLIFYRVRLYRTSLKTMYHFLSCSTLGHHGSLGLVNALDARILGILADGRFNFVEKQNNVVQTEVLSIARVQISKYNRLGLGGERGERIWELEWVECQSSATSDMRSTQNEVHTVLSFQRPHHGDMGIGGKMDHGPVFADVEIVKTTFLGTADEEVFHLTFMHIGLQGAGVLELPCLIIDEIFAGNNGALEQITGITAAGARVVRGARGSGELWVGCQALTHDMTETASELEVAQALKEMVDEAVGDGPRQDRLVVKEENMEMLKPCNHKFVAHNHSLVFDKYLTFYPSDPEAPYSSVDRLEISVVNEEVARGGTRGVGGNARGAGEWWDVGEKAVTGCGMWLEQQSEWTH
ncbi:hypothetical protein P691DRAFT_839419 [Macrolepiota fuliginosa MF-IS2]|uniref:Uncharacterized protein n=1 Tax=Macrolepiota fuliginosa MF-IS2 TaxID=1400762 RepID=A0A9P5X3Z5_9AGAR|nr:hypothetical protein P691DRAFT_839419 [Macrolepiota fuliginosa MF-IS2]